MQLCCTPQRVQLFALFVATITIVGVLIILFLFNYPTFARHRILDAVVFKDGSQEMERFKTTAELVNLRMSIYVYTVTNADEVVKSSSKINLKEIGPFVYHEYKSKEFVDNNQVTGLITYKLRKRYTFLPDQSIGDPTVMNITWPNVPLIAARSVLDNLPFFERQAAYMLMNNAIKSKSEPAFITDTVENFIFDGSKRELFESLQNSFPFSLLKPWPLPDNKFAIFYDKNNTWYSWRDHLFTTSAGFGTNQDYHNLNQYIYMNQSATLPYWRKEPAQCNQINGTDGQFFAPFMDKTQNIMVYSADICRKVSLKYRHNFDLSRVTVYKYTLDEKDLLSGTKNPENDCYCLQRDKDDNPLPECQLDGLMDLSSCVAPNVVASGAHFLYGSPELWTRIAGISPPNATVDEPVIYAEPNTGLSIQVKVPIQLNIRLDRGGFNLFNFFQEDKPLIIPLFYGVEAAELTEDQASLLRSKLLLLDSWFVSMVLGGAIVLILAIGAAAAVLCMRFRGSRQARTASETEPLLSSTNSNQANSANQQGGDNQSGNQANTYQTI